MKVKNLKEMLENLDPEAIVLVDEDSDLTFYKNQKAYDDEEQMLAYINMELGKLRMWDAEEGDFK